MTKEEKYINDLCESIVERIIQNNIFNKTEILKIMNPLIRTGMHDVADMQLSIIHKQIDEKKQQLAQVVGRDRIAVDVALASLNDKARRLNKLKTEITYHFKYHNLMHILKDKLSPEQMEMIRLEQSKTWK